MNSKQRVIAALVRQGTPRYHADIDCVVRSVDALGHVTVVLYEMARQRSLIPCRLCWTETGYHASWVMTRWERFEYESRQASN